MKKIIALLLAALTALALCACGQGAAQPAHVAAGETFKMGDETYFLEKWVRCPEYDSDEKVGYGLCFLQVEGIAPIVISSGGYSSLIDMTLDVEGGAVSTRNISFIGVEDVEGFAGRVTFEFALDKGAVLPASGTFYHTGKDQQENIDLSSLSAPDGGAAAAPTIEAALSDEAKRLCGSWKLHSITFETPEADNGIFSIDATMEVSDGFEYGLALELGEDGSFYSDIDLDGLTKAVQELPFATDELNFQKYSEWSCEDNKMTLSPDGHVFVAALEESGDLSVTWCGEVEIESTTVNGAASKAGVVAIYITMTLSPKN